MRGFFPGLLAFTDGDVWRPGIGDPTVMGWLTVLAYFVAAALCVRMVLRGMVLRVAPAPLLFWGLLGVMLVLLGINKQLDLQTWLTLAFRRMAVSQGWYEYRRIFQFFFVLVVMLAGTAVFAAIWMLVRKHRRELKLPLAGFVLLAAFVIIRAASFHHVDQILRFSLAGVRINWILELTGIGMIIAGALRPPSSGRTGYPGRRRMAAA